jgi:hypothetical protein
MMTDTEKTFSDLVGWTMRARALREQIARHAEPPDGVLCLADVLDAEALRMIDPLLSAAKAAGPAVLVAALDALSDGGPLDTLPEGPIRDCLAEMRMLDALVRASVRAGEAPDAA